MNEPNPSQPKDPEPAGREESGFRVNDRRHWARAEAREEGAADAEASAASPSEPTVVGELRRRTEEAERKLLEYVTAFRQTQAEQEQVRERLARDVERRVQLAFGALVAELLECVDDLDLASAHATAVKDAEPLARGVALARDRFLAALQKAGVERFDLDGAPFDPNVAEAIRVVPVDSAERSGTVVETLRPGYRLGEHMLRPAQVAVGRHGD